MGNPVVTAILLVLRLGIGLILLRLALDSRYRNLHWLAAVFYLNFLNLFLRGSDLWPASQVLMIVIQICLAMFTHTTFYQHRRSPVVWVIAGLVVAGSASLYLSLRVPSYGGLQPIALLCALNWFWHALVAWQVWRTLGSDRSVEDWVKMRYVMVVTYAVAMSVALPVADLAQRRTPPPCGMVGDPDRRAPAAVSGLGHACGPAAIPESELSISRARRAGAQHDGRGHPARPGEAGALSCAFRSASSRVFSGSVALGQWRSLTLRSHARQSSPRPGHPLTRGCGRPPASCLASATPARGTSPGSCPRSAGRADPCRSGR